MKQSDGFNARRLRPRGTGNWRMRFASALAALFAVAGVLLAMAGAATLLGRPPALGSLNDSPTGSAVILVIGLLLLWISISVWRMCRRRLRSPGDLSMSRHLMKKRK
ncbi:hypothetical protein [Pseudomonas sp. M30-35]|uniref:hypothetical protein n=1 Tax=Pseudomonas sp. M30-35 TaxID=1981174 RepID=UPI000B3C9852|nr:hypothetical protein [Pseudomonas sp. M30-35]ARU88202.1 hypothetical protein B9K09_09575 [Pseudomonas sp. M30-35]